MHWPREPLPKYKLSSTDTERNSKWDLLKLKSLCKAKVTVSKTKQQPTELEKIFTNPRSDRIYKELKKLVIKRTNNPIKNGVQT